MPPVVLRPTDNVLPLKQTCISIAGYFMLATIQDNHARYGAVWLVVIGLFSSVPLCYMWLVSNSSGETKRGFALIFLGTIGQCGPVLGTVSGEKERGKDRVVPARFLTPVPFGHLSGSASSPNRKDRTTRAACTSMRVYCLVSLSSSLRVLHWSHHGIARKTVRSQRRSARVRMVVVAASSKKTQARPPAPAPAPAASPLPRSSCASSGSSTHASPPSATSCIGAGSTYRSTASSRSTFGTTFSRPLYSTLNALSNFPERCHRAAAQRLRRMD